MWTLKFKGQLTNPFFATVDQMFGGSSQFPTTAECAEIETVLGSSRRLGGAAERLTDGSAKRMYRLSFEF